MKIYKFGIWFLGKYCKYYYRRRFDRLLEERFGNQPITVCEIGVGEGYHAKLLLKHLNIRKMYLVDPYCKYNQDTRTFDTSTQYDTVKNNLREYKDKVVIIKKKSVDATEHIKEKFDAIYIDGNHDYSTVMMDIQLYKGLLKPNGVLGGHNFESYDVAKAVVEFANEENKEVDVSRCIPLLDWVVK